MGTSELAEMCRITSLYMEKLVKEGKKITYFEQKRIKQIRRVCYDYNYLNCKDKSKGSELNIF